MTKSPVFTLIFASRVLKPYGIQYFQKSGPHWDCCSTAVLCSNALQWPNRITASDMCLKCCSL